MQNKNLFALLPDDVDDVYYIAAPSPDAAVETAAPKKAPAGQKENKKQYNDTINKSRAANNKSSYEGSNVRYNGYQTKNRSWGSGGDNDNGNYKGSSYQKYNGERSYQNNYRDNGSLNDYSNGHKQFANQRKGGESGEEERLEKPATGDGKEVWKMVRRPSRENSLVGEVRSEVSFDSVEDEETRIRRERRERWEKENEEEAKLKTLKQYEEERKKEEKEPKETRIVALDKELEAMRPLSRKHSVSVTDMKSDKNKEKKKENAGKQEDVCKKIVQLFLKPNNFQRQRYNNSFQFKGKDNTVEGSNPKGTAPKGFSGKGKDSIEVKSADREAVDAKSQVVVDLKFDDAAQFPALK